MTQFRNAKFVDANETIDAEILEGSEWVWNTISPIKRPDLYLAAYDVATPYVPVDDTAAQLEEFRNSLSLTFPQLLIGLTTEGWMSIEDGRLWNSGTLPTPVVDAIAAIPTEQLRFNAETRAINPSIVLRNDPVVAAVGAAQQKTPEELDQFFIDYSEV